MTLEILIVDDDRQLAAACARHLEQAGYVCRQAHDGRQALTEIRQSAPALVLLDLLIPKLDGRALLAELHRHPSSAGLPVLVMSGIYKDARTQADCQAAGARGFLEKPFEMPTLITEVQSILGQAAVPNAPGSGELRVPLSDVPVSEYLWRAMRGGFSGAVHFQRAKLHKVLLIQRGAPLAIRSNVMRETLGERMVQSGRITARQHETSLRRSKDEQRLQGEILIEMGVLTEPAVARCVEDQVEEKLLETFRWTEGEAWMVPGVERVSYGSPITGWSPEEVILCGSLQMRVERVTAILSTFGTYYPVALRTALPERAARSAPLAAALRAAGEAKNVNALLDEHAGPLYGLWLTGAVQFTSEAPQRARAAAPAPARAAAAAPIPDAVDPLTPRRAAARSLAAAPAAGASPADESLVALLEAWRKQTFFEVLQLSESATREEVQAAYLELARQYHPDRFSRSGERTRECANQIFALLSSARDTLTDQSARAEYARQLRGENPTDERAKVQRILRAEKLCRDGEGLLRKRDVSGALACFGEAVELDPSEGEFHVLFAWADFLAHRASGGEAAEKKSLEALQKATELAPESPKGYYYQAMLHKACGRPDQARKLFNKVLQIDPEHSEALSEKRLLNLRKDKDQGGGLFGFGRKKS